MGRDEKKVIDAVKAYLTKHIDEDALEHLDFASVDIGNNQSIRIGFNIHYPHDKKHIVSLKLKKDNVVVGLDASDLDLVASNMEADLRFSICDIFHSQIYWHGSQKDELIKLMKSEDSWVKEFDMSPSGNEFENVFSKTSLYYKILDRVEDVMKSGCKGIVDNSPVAGYNSFIPLVWLYLDDSGAEYYDSKNLSRSSYVDIDEFINYKEARRMPDVSISEDISIDHVFKSKYVKND